LGGIFLPLGNKKNGSANSTTTKKILQSHHILREKN
jgi:hypothetical protein